MKKSDRVALATQLHGNNVSAISAASESIIEAEYVNVTLNPSEDVLVSFDFVEDFYKVEHLELSRAEAKVWDTVMDFYPSKNGYNSLTYLAEQGMGMSEEIFENEHTYTPEAEIDTKTFRGWLNSLTEDLRGKVIQICSEYAEAKFIGDMTTFEINQINGKDGVHLSEGDYVAVKYPGTAKIVAGKIARAPINGYILCVFQSGVDYLATGGNVQVIDIEEHPSGKVLKSHLDPQFAKLMKNQTKFLQERTDVYMGVAERVQAKAEKTEKARLAKVLAMLKKAQKNGALVYTEAVGKKPQSYTLGEHTSTTLEALAEMVSLEEATTAFEARQAEIAKAKEGIVEQISAMKLDSQEAVDEAVALVNKQKLNADQSKAVNALIRNAKAELKKAAKEAEKADKVTEAEIVEPTAEVVATAPKTRKPKGKQVAK